MGLTALLESLENNAPSEQQQDATTLLSNATFELSNIKNDLIKPDLNQQYSHCKQTIPTTEWLFGDDLS